jgi:hypothetical protein
MKEFFLMKYWKIIKVLNQNVMKTNIRFKHLLSLFLFCILLLAGTTSLQAQSDRGRGEGHGRENKHSEYRVEPRGRYHDYDGRRYYSRAPWGMHRPISLYHNHNRIYYYGGHYYEFYPDRGYCMIEIPMGYVFDEVPYGFSRVWVDGRWCYRRGGLYLRPGIHGFITFPGPAGIRLGAGF